MPNISHQNAKQSTKPIMEGSDVKTLRENLGLTQEELAQKIGVSRNTIINYERGGVIPESKQQLFVSLFEVAAVGMNADRIYFDAEGNFVAEGDKTGSVIKGKPIPTPTQRATAANDITVPREVFDQITKLTAAVSEQQKERCEFLSLIKSQQVSIESLTRSVETLSKKRDTADDSSHAAPRAAQG